MATVTKAANRHTAVATGWTSPENAYATTGNDSYATLASAKNATRSGDFGFPDFTTADIPDGSTITGATIYVEWGMTASVTGGLLGCMPRVNNADAGTELTKTTTTEAAESVAFTTLPTLAQLRSAQTSDLVEARLRVTKGSTSTGMTGNLDYVYIVVAFTPPNPTGTGALTTQKPTVSGTGSHLVNPSGTGALTTQKPSVAGTGSHVTPLSGVGALTTRPPVVAGTGSLILTGTGALTTQLPTVAGTGALVLTATGSLTTQPPSVSGTGAHTVTHSGTGALTLQPPTVAGTGSHTTSATTGVARLQLAAGWEPASRTEHSIRLRARVTSGTGTLYAALYEGASNRSGDLSQALTTSLADYTLAIADVDAANITSYAALELRIWGEASAGVVFEVDQAWLAVPTGPIPEYTGTGALALQPPAIAGTGQEVLTGYWRPDPPAALRGGRRARRP